MIGLDQGALVIESKGLSAAVRGDENGDWHVRLASGRWKEMPNAYAQALAEKLALRDAMAAFVGTEVPYPDAALIFVPAIPSVRQSPKATSRSRLLALTSCRNGLFRCSAAAGPWISGEPLRPIIA